MPAALLILCFNSCQFLADKNAPDPVVLQHERDSLLEVSQEYETQLSDLTEFISAISEGLDSISIQERVLNIPTGEGTLSSKEKIRRDISNFENMLERQKVRINQLSDSLAAMGRNVTKLNKLVAYLNDEISQKESEIKDIRAQRGRSNVKIAALEEANDSLTSAVIDLQYENEDQQSEIKAQDLALNEAYVLVGTKKELQAMNILDANSLKKSVNYSSLNKSKMMKVDIRKFESLEFDAKQVTVLTPMPSGSYRIVEQSSTTKQLVVEDYAKFWSVSKYLIILTK